MTFTRPGVAASAAVLPCTWWGRLLPLGTPSPGGVIVWHPDHLGVEGDHLAAVAGRVPVDLAADRIPLVWQRTPGEAASPEPLELGAVEAAWLDDDGVLCVAGTYKLDDDGAVSFMSTAAIEANEGRALVIAAELRAPVPVDGDWFQYADWRLRAVALQPAERATWPAPIGRFWPIKRGAPYPVPESSRTSRRAPSAS